nr:unnamed protein product [Callosobruchus chinensis]
MKQEVPKRALGSNEQPGSAKKARKYFSPSNLLTLYEAQISLEYCSHICGAPAPTTLSVLDAVQKRAIRLIGDPALTCHLQPVSHRRAVGDLSLFYRYSNGFCSSELTSIISPHRTFVPRVSRAWNGLPGNSGHSLAEVKSPSATAVSAKIRPFRKIWHYIDADWDDLRDFSSAFLSAWKRTSRKQPKGPN